MRWILDPLARLFGVTFEDWMMTLVLIATLALAVGGVRSCTYDQFRDARPSASDSR
jgi:hypothetical protein